MEERQSIVADAPACAGCRYNLHGQRARFDADSGRWTVVCPECGVANVVRINDGRPAPAASYAIVGLTLIGLYVVLLLGGAVAGGVSELMLTFHVFAAQSQASSIGRGLEDALLNVLLLLLSRGLGIALAAAGVGMLVSLAPYGGPARASRLAIAIVLVACAIGANGAPAHVPIATAQQTATLSLALMTGGWAWAAFVAGTLIALAGARVGSRVGRPLAMTFCELFVPPEWRPRDSAAAVEVRR